MPHIYQSQEYDANFNEKKKIYEYKVKKIIQKMKKNINRDGGQRQIKKVINKKENI